MYLSYIYSNQATQNIKLKLNFSVDQATVIDVFVGSENGYSQDYYTSKKFQSEINKQTVEFELNYPDSACKIRIDPGSSRSKWKIYSINLVSNSEIFFGSNEIYKMFIPTKDIENFRLEKDHIAFETTGNDPMIESTFNLKSYYTSLFEKKRFSYVEVGFIFLLITLFFFISKKGIFFSPLEVNSKNVFVILFLGIITLPGLYMFLFPQLFENKKVNNLSKPEFKLHDSKKYFSDYSIYFQENMGFKNELIFLNSYYKLKIFKSSAKPDVVAIGKNNWFYYTSYATIGDYQNTSLFTNDELLTIKNNIEELHSYFKLKGIDFYIMVAPNKTNIYPENLPWYIRLKNKKSKSIQVSEYLNQNSTVKMFEFTNLMLKSKENTDMFYNYDTHWNFQAGFLVCQKLIDSISYRHSFLPMLDFKNYENKKVYGDYADLSVMLGLDPVLKNEEWMPVKKTPVNYVYITPKTYPSQYIFQSTIHSVNVNAALPKVLVYRDSFFNLLLPFFSESFGEVVYVWSTDFTSEVIDGEMPKIVLYEMIESRLDKLLQDNPKFMKDELEKASNIHP